jgi:hypothetical protein
MRSISEFIILFTILLIDFLIKHDVNSTCSTCINKDTLVQTQLNYEKRNIEQVRATRILNNLLKNYSRDVRPGYYNKCNFLLKL